MERQNKHIDQLVEKMMKDTSLESPSSNFTNTIMSQVEVIANSDITTYKPLISKRAWLILGSVVLLVILYSLFAEHTTEEGITFINNFKVSAKNKFTSIISHLNFSKTITYTMGLFAMMLLLQIPLLKDHYNKRFNY